MTGEEAKSQGISEAKEQEITRQELVERVSEHVNRILRRNLYELKLDEKQTFRLLRQKEETGICEVRHFIIFIWGTVW